MSFLLGANFAIALAAAAMLAMKGQRGASDNWLIGQMALTGLIMVALYGAIAGWPLPQSLQVAVSGPAFMALPVIFHIYLRSITMHYSRLDLLWFVPVVLYGVLMLALVAGAGSGVELDQGLVTVTSPGPLAAYIAPLPILFFVILPLLELRELRQHEQRLQERYASIDKFDLRWIRRLLLIQVGVVLLSAAVIFLGNQLTLVAFDQAFAGILILLMSYNLALALLATRQVPMDELVAGMPESGGDTDAAPSPEDLEAITAALLADGLYRQETCSLDHLAAALRRPPWAVSAEIKNATGGTFYDIVNELRVREATRLLSDPKNANISILAIAFDAGFQSKSTFNRVFRNSTGQTPSAFRRSVHAESG